jgi:UDP-N-acetylglucosamine 2-epimerase
VLCKADKNDIVSSTQNTHTDPGVFKNNYFGDGNAAEKITRILEETVF